MTTALGVSSLWETEKKNGKFYVTAFSNLPQMKTDFIVHISFNPSR